MIDDINTLLTNNPSLTDEELVTELNKVENFYTLKQKMLTTDVLRIFMSQNQLYEYFVDATSGNKLLAADHMKSGGDFNFMIGHPLYIGDLLLTIKEEEVVDGIKTSLQNLYDTCVAYSNRKAPKYNVTLQDVKIARNPASWQPVTIASGNDKVVLISNSNKGGFRFTITPAESFTGQLQIRILAKKYDETEFALQSSYPINVSKSWTAEQSESHVFQRAAGLAGYKHFQFEFLAPYSGAVGEVSVESIA